MKRFNCGFEAALGILFWWGAAARADLTIMPLGGSATTAVSGPASRVGFAVRSLAWRSLPCLAERVTLSR
jgi:hypothetical protein